jgi:hypothetical protein
MDTAPLNLTGLVTPEQMGAVKTRLIQAADVTLAKIPEPDRARDGRDLIQLKKAVESLPDLRLMVGLLYELKVVTLDALVDAGVSIPYATWAALGVEAFRREPADPDVCKRGGR